LGNVLSNL
jgi:hypothetical protein